MELDEISLEEAHATFGYHFQAGLLLQSDNCYSTTAGKLPFAPAVMTQGLKFLQLCLETSADVNEEQRLTNQTLVPVSCYLDKLHGTSSNCVDAYLDLLLQSLGPAGGTHIHVHVHVCIIY